MKRLIICLAALCAASTGLAQDKAQLKDQKDKASYSIGHDIGTTFKKQNIELNLDALIAGLKDALGGKPPVLTKEERDKVLELFQKEMAEKQVAASKEAAVKNAAEGEKFLAENKKKDGIKTTASGLQYKVLKEGTGPTPKETDTVMTNYKGTLIDGTEFDNSEKHGGPATFKVTGVIKGWTEVLQLMKTGSKYQIFVPSSLAYGERARSQEIGPNSTLIFELELLSIVPPESTASAPSAQGTPAAIAPAKPNPSAPAASSPPAKPSPSVAVKPVKPTPSASPK
jgi:FKBP-type peptidyl-prolyl cis-trans isomerase FklB